MTTDFKYADDAAALAAPVRPKPEPRPQPQPVRTVFAPEMAEATPYYTPPKKESHGAIIRIGAIVVLMGLGAWALAATSNSDAPRLGEEAAQSQLADDFLPAPAMAPVQPAPIPEPIAAPQVQQPAPAPAPVIEEPVPAPQTNVTPSAEIEAAPPAIIEPTPPPAPAADLPNLAAPDPAS